MSYSFGKSIVKDGLVFYVDAANGLSYSGSGTTLSDLIGNDNGTLTNGPVFSSDNGGKFIFDGTDDYIRFSTLNPEQNSSLSYSLWVRPTSTSSDGTLLGNWATSYMTYFDVGGAVANFRSLIRLSNGGLAATDVNTANATLNAWNYVTTTLDSTDMRLYVNGVLNQTSSSGAGAATGGNGSGIGAEDALGARYFTGDIATCEVYNRAITAAEVVQNYNALKQRFF
jgi:hypothetical protein